MATVLVTDGGRGMSRSALAATRALGSVGHRVITTESGGGELAAESRYSSQTVRVPASADRAAFAAAVARIVADASVAHVFATSDDAVLALEPTLDRLLDKQRLAVELDRLGIPSPPSYTLAAGDPIPDEVTWPSVVKPLTGAEPARVVTSVDDLTAHLAGGSAWVVQPFVEGPMAAIAGVCWDDEIVACVHQRYVRTWPVSCGTASSATTVEPDHDRERALAALLAGHDGIFQAQYVDGRLIDLNPRPYGSMPLAVAAGANLPDLVVRLRDGWRPSGVVRGRPGVVYRWVEGDLRSVTARVRDRTLSPLAAVAQLAPRRGTAHSVVSLRDPRPALRRARHVVTTARRGTDR